MIKGIVFLIVLAVSFFMFPKEGNVEVRKVKSVKKVFTPPEEHKGWVDSVFSEMSLRDKVEQLFMPYAYGFDSLENKKNFNRIIKIAENYKIGGILFLRGNTKGFIKLINKLNEYSDIPLFVSADFERGPGMRLNDGVEFPSNMAVAATDDPQLTYLMGKATGIEAKLIGVNINFAPVLDINTDSRNPVINVRAFSDNKYLTAKHGIALIRGLSDGGIIATAKHFPGHGSTNLDSHLELPIIPLTENELIDRDLYPFLQAIRYGVDAIMIAHLEVPAFEKIERLPATLSVSIVNDLLKEKLGFEGLIITDAMNMHAITNNFSISDANKFAFLAGNDIILMPPDDSVAIESFYQSVLNSEIPESRIDYSVKKILNYKKKFGLQHNYYIDSNEVMIKINSISHHRLSAEIAEKSVTLLKDESNILPLDLKKYKKIVSISLLDSKNRKDDNTFQINIKKQLNANCFTLNYNSKNLEYNNALYSAKYSDLIIIPIELSVKSFYGSISLNSKYKDFIEQLFNLNIPMVVISLGSPYIINEIPFVKTYINVYGENSYSQTAAVKGLLNQFPIQGKSPIEIQQNEFPLGSGIDIPLKELVYSSISIDTLYDFSIVDSLMNTGVEEKVFPGATLIIGRNGKIIYEKQFGKFTYEKNSPKVNQYSIFDLASLTKVCATTAAAMILYDDELLNLDRPVSYYIPEFKLGGKENILVKNLLLHNSGFPSWLPFYKMYDNPNDVINHIYNLELKNIPGQKYEYSDINMIMLQKIIETVSGVSIDKFLDDRIYKIIGMTNTTFNPDQKLKKQCVPTEKDTYWRNRIIQGEVHDEAASLLGGVAGHAGLFSSARDLAIYAQLFLNKGVYGTKRIFSERTVEFFTKKYSGQSSRALGWDTKSETGSSFGKIFSNNSFGHTGFTGTSIWIDPDNQVFVILLTNRIYPSRDNRKIIGFRPKLHDEIAKSVLYLF